MTTTGSLRLLLVGLLAIVLSPPLCNGQQTFSLQRAPSPVDNPLKGLVPYARPTPGRFPHSMEFGYLPLSKLMLADDRFEWGPLEEVLDDIVSRGNQTVLRIFLEYPGKTEGIPQYLVDGGLKVHEYLNTNTAPFPPTKVLTPDYEDVNLRRALQQFITAFGDKYDGDARLAYITAGLLGTWGEWHTYPKNELWASKETQRIVLDAYEVAFQSTPVLLRYPAGPETWAQAENAERPFGYHDDSFCWATLDTGKADDNWFYMPALKSAGAAALNKWKTQPIGGEIRPEVWGKIFDDRSEWPKGAQSFPECVRQTHATWMLDTGMVREQPSAKRLQTATEQVREMGYDLYVKQATFAVDIKDQRLSIDIELINEGVAPFYANWPTEIGLADADGKLVQQQITPALTVRGKLPGTHRLKDNVAIKGASGELQVLMRVVHPLPNGKPLRFANETQDQTRPGWLTLGEISLD